MIDGLVNRKVLMVVAPTNFRDEEYQQPKKVLETAGAKVITASKGVKEAKGMLGTVVKVDLDLEEVKIDDYEGVVFIGGSGSAVYFEDSQVLSLAKSAADKGKIIGAICIAPSILANAGLLAGKQATAFPSQQGHLISRGAKFINNDLLVEGKIITASGPQAAVKFGQALVEALKN